MGASKACPSCRKKWELSFKFCPEDGTPLLLHQEQAVVAPSVAVEDDWFDELDPSLVATLSPPTEQAATASQVKLPPDIESFRHAPTVMVMPAISQQFVKGLEPTKRVRTGETPKVEREIASARGSVKLPPAPTLGMVPKAVDSDDEPWPEVSEGPARLGSQSQYQETILQHVAVVLPKDHPLYQEPKTPQTISSDDPPSVIVASDLVPDASSESSSTSKTRSSGLFWFRSGGEGKSR